MKQYKGKALRDVLKIAKKTYKKKGGMMGQMPPMGGGSLYTFAGGPYTDSVLPDGAAPTQRLANATWQGPSELLGGRRRRRATRRRRHRGGVQPEDAVQPEPPVQPEEIPPMPNRRPQLVRQNAMVDENELPGPNPNANPNANGGRRTRRHRRR